MRDNKNRGFVKSIAILLVGIGAVLAFFWFRNSKEIHSSDSFNTVAVDRGNVLQSVLATGILNPVRTVQVGSQISGNIMELLADFNTLVKQGEVVARIDPAIYEANVSLANAEVERSLAGYELARVQWERLASLHERAVVSDSDLDEAKARMRQAHASLQISKYVLEKSELELQRCTIISPVDGIVISRNVDVGQTVAASLSAPVLFEIAEDLTQMEINSYVSEADIGRIKKGQRVVFRVDAFRNQPFPGTVIQVRNAAMVRDNVVSYDAVVRVSNPDLLLKPGMTAEVEFVTAEREDVLRIRNTALRARIPEPLQPPPLDLPDDPDWRRVYRQLPGGALETVAVRLGITDGLHTEIVEGLKMGDSLVTGLALRTGASVRSGSSLLQGNQQPF